MERDREGWVEDVKRKTGENVKNNRWAKEQVEQRKRDLGDRKKKISEMK